MLALGLVNASGTWLGDELANAADVVAELAARLDAQAGGVAVRERELRVLIERATALLETLGVTGSALLARIQKTVPLRRGVYRYVV